MRLATFCLFLMLPMASCSNRPDSADLQAVLEQAAEGFDGRVGIFAQHLQTGVEAGINADSLFPTASMIKVPILVATFDAIERGELSWDQELVYRDSLLYPGVDIMGSFVDSSTVTLAKGAMLMITTSDNTASLWLQHLSGTGIAINQWLSTNGFEATRMNSRTPDRRPDWERFGWGQTTPREMARLMTMIRQGSAVSRAASEEMYRVLTRIHWNDEALSRLPPWVQAASKQGAVSESRSEVVLVNGPSGDFVFTVITDGQADTSWEYDNEGFVLIREVATALWEFFEPEHPWQPAEGWQRYTLGY
ncbi:MAG: serine hydrolase [Rhodothermales bacterium]|nr:serine hydrolase [Rhodothermales bacterium]MBO6779553.1 serine hydrolase [Rhodothermales bacterium]